jgi:group I intron endonuclease
MNILYKLTFPNGKVYIGITTESLSRRVQRHIAYARANKPYAVSAAIRKYGEKSFIAEHIASSKNWIDLTFIERLAIEQYNSICPFGYNMTGGGEGSYKVSPSDEKRRKISESLTGRKLSEDHRRAVGLAQKGKVISAETKLKMSEAHRNRRPMSQEQREIRSEAAKKQHAARRLSQST